MFIAIRSSANANVSGKRNKETIGKLCFHKRTDGDNTYVKITSEFHTRFVWSIDLQTTDFAHFKNNRLLTSKVCRSVNGKDKGTKKTSWEDNHYALYSGNSMTVLHRPINHNMMMLYAFELKDLLEIYSDNFQCFLHVERIASHQYRIKLPDGSYNVYSFENGLCKSIVSKHRLYTIEMELSESAR